MSQAIHDLHLQQLPFTVRRITCGWQVACDCGKLTAPYGLISGALNEQWAHGAAHPNALRTVEASVSLSTCR
jgi:hypothetical protein